MGFFDVVNLPGLIFAAVMAVVYFVFLKKHGDEMPPVENKGMLYIERIGKYASLFLMAINVGVLEGGFTSELMEKYWLVSTSVMLVLYLIMWVFIFKNGKKACAYIAAVDAALIFIQSGLLQQKTLLLTAGLVFLAGEIYVLKKM